MRTRDEMGKAIHPMYIHDAFWQSVYAQQQLNYLISMIQHDSQMK